MANPVWITTYPKLGSQATDSATFLVKTDIDSTAYFVVVPQGDPAPTNIQVIASQDHTGTPVGAGLSGSVSILANVEGSLAAILAPGTNYDAYVLAVGMPPFGTPQLTPANIRFSTLPLIIGQTIIPRSKVGAFVTISLVNLRVATPKDYPGSFKITALPGTNYQIDSLNETNVVIQVLNNPATSESLGTRLVNVQVSDGTSPPSPTFEFKVSVSAAAQSKSKPVGYNIPGITSR
jgi:hypothetical protein